MVEKPYERKSRELFEKAVATYFKPIAEKHRFPLVKIGGNIYEIPTIHVILRIGLYSGHGSGRNLATTLRQVTLCDFVESSPHNQFGLGWFASFTGIKIDPFQADLKTDDGFLKLTQFLADLTERFAVPYLLGQKDDFEAVREFAVEKIENNLETKKMKEMTRQIERNPKIVKAWPVVIPREKGEEWETAKELKDFNGQFLGDMNGKKEQIFKEKLIEFFKRDQSVNAAYLARIVGLGIPATAALCLRTQFGFDKGMMEKIGKIFAPVFSIQENFNVIFLTEQQELLLAKLARPFFKEKIGSS
jgi:hypothetical protein